jgi:probable rRNA maturation factor
MQKPDEAVRRPLLNLVEIRVINVDKPIWIEDLESFCSRVLEELGKRDWSISVVLSDDDFIRGLNRRYRNNDNPTDVLSFPQIERVPGSEYFEAGDIVVSLPYMRRNARDFGERDGEELQRLLVHGILHLTGMDHEEHATDGEMLELQELILQKLTGELKF